MFIKSGFQRYALVSGKSQGKKEVFDLLPNSSEIMEPLSEFI